MSKYYEFKSVIQLSGDSNEEDFLDQFIDFVEKRGKYHGGFLKEEQELNQTADLSRESIQDGGTQIQQKG